MVVIGIMILLITIAIPAVGPMMASSHMAEAVNTLNGLVTTAQTAAQANATPVAIRIEPAFQTAKFTAPNGDVYDMIAKDATGRPKLLDYQQARLVVFASRQLNSAGGVNLSGLNQQMFSFRQLPGSKVTPLPRSIWAAPLNVLNPTTFGPLDDASLDYQPKNHPSISAGYGNNANAAPFSRLDTFYIIFDASGQLIQFLADEATPSTHYWYVDENQPYTISGSQLAFQLIDHPDDSQRGLLLYNRSEYKGLPNDNPNRQTFFSKARPVYVNRYLGGLVEGRMQ